MQRAVSANRLNQSSHDRLSKSPSLRGIYINEQTSKKCVNTYFHSPFKEGKRNRDFVNPSFVSNHLFYPKEILEKKADVIVRNSYIPPASQTMKQTQYRERMRTESNNYNQLLQKTQQYSRKVKEQRTQVQVKESRLVEPDQLLKRELNSLINYRERIDTTKDKEKGNQDTIPPYFQKIRRDTTYETDLMESKQRQIQQFMKHDRTEKSQQKQKLRNERQKQNRNLQRNIMENIKDVATQEKINKNKSNLLANILREQMLIRNKSKPLV